MSKDSLYVGQHKLDFENKNIEGQLVNFDDELYYKIVNCDQMRPFFMSVVSDSNHWMFIGSNGGVSAGRKDCDSALFPYYTDDKIIESSDITGSKTIFRIQKNGKTYLWEPFSDRYTGIYNLQRNLYKNTYGNKIVFEEINDDLGVTYRYQWNSSNDFGFVKKTSVLNHSEMEIDISVLDGIQNIVPFGISADLQNSKSNLVDAYKKNELQPDVGIGIFALSAVIVDKAEPSEALKATIAWSAGVKSPKYLVSSLQLNDFRSGLPVKQETDVRAEKGAYFVHQELKLQPGNTEQWIIVANVSQSILSISDLTKRIQAGDDLIKIVQENIDLGTKRLLELTAAADGLQYSADQMRNIRHFSNTLFNIMRGGTFDNNYQIEKSDFIPYIQKANNAIYKKKEAELNQLPEVFDHGLLMQMVQRESDPHMKRLVYEYMPLKFSWRHGDPSRPWNRFSINTTSEIDGSKILDYEGNWRDIFQNWEALSLSYPEFIDSMIHKFVNASTFDGYNPYRVTKDGIDWEIIEADDPWSYIGYWGDHQIIYLLKFLEIIEDHYPGKLAEYFDNDVFVYANVPYKIKPYQDILNNPKDTIDFDHELNNEIERRRENIGADGALLRLKNEEIYNVNLIEKLLATVLSKLSNFIPEAGIWMNTQRPEWNDANNALVGNGVSMVTLCYLRRFLAFFLDRIEAMTKEELSVSKELGDFFAAINSTFEAHKGILGGTVSDKMRKTVLDRLGIAGSEFRETIYQKGFSGEKNSISKDQMIKFTKIALDYLDHTILANRRSDNLYHAYNLMTVEDDQSTITVSRLPIMLEGQVAVLSSGLISGTESLELLDAMKNSDLFRHDQYSYLLYPDKELARFVEKNIIPSEKVNESQLLTELLNNKNNTIIVQDVFGKYHFNGNFNNAESLKKALAELPQAKYGPLVEKDYDLVLDIFESVFDHKSFTGRSGTFYGYEGLGSIYWHMVSKLLLSVEETCLRAVDNESEVTVGKLMEHYYEILEGIGVHKSPDLYGAFPTDPYSHTPGGKGAQQPGMTGQVKEDILSRIGELGVFVREGQLVFNPTLLRISEFLTEPYTFSYPDINQDLREINLDKDSLCFTYCQVPIIYQLAENDGLVVSMNDYEKEFDQLRLDKETSHKIFSRSGEITKIVVSLEKRHLN